MGRPVPQNPWRAFEQRTGIPVIIDGGASFECVSATPERFLGEIPTVLSFHATKSFSTAEGGGIITTVSAHIMRLQAALNFGFGGGRDSKCANVNGKMSEYHAAIGLAQLDGWQEKSLALREVADLYRSK